MTQTPEPSASKGNNETCQLLGKLVSVHPSLSLVEQVHDILLEAIRNGRWTKNEKLPSISALSRESGLSRFPIQHAYDLLAHDGFLRQEGQRGTFLESTRGREEGRGYRIGLAIEVWPDAAGRYQPKPCRFWQLHNFMELAKERGHEIETTYIPVDADWKDINRQGAFFKSNVEGIISTFPFSRPDFTDTQNGYLPLVFFGSATPDSLPYVTTDSWLAGYMMTRKAREKGHQDILILTDDQELGTIREDFFAGHCNALEQDGIAPNKLVFEQSAHTQASNLAGLGELLEQNRNSTAILTSNESLAVNVITLCDLAKIAIPDELSIITRGLTPPRPTEKNQRVSAYHNREKTHIEICVNLLSVFIETGEPTRTRVVLPPHFINGDTLASPSRNLACNQA